MKRIKIDIRDKKILKAFVGLKTPTFVHDFHFEMDSDEYFCIAERLLKGDIEGLKVYSIDSKLKNEIWDYVLKNNLVDDQIYLSMLKTIEIIFTKYIKV